MNPADDAESADQIRRIISMHRVPILLGCTAVIFIALSIVVFTKYAFHAAPIQIHKAGSVQGSTTSGPLTVDVEGAVVKPGIKTLPTQSRINDALVAAGGLTGDADAAYVESQLNLAAPVSDGYKLYIPRRNESMTSHNINWGEQGSPGALEQTQSISVNTSTRIELESLPGIGPVTATKIIAGRPYRSLDELVVKKVIGKNVYEKIKSQLIL